MRRGPYRPPGEWMRSSENLLMRPHLRHAFEVLQRRHEVSTRGLTSADHSQLRGGCEAASRLYGQESGFHHQLQRGWRRSPDWRPSTCRGRRSLQLQSRRAGRCRHRHRSGKSPSRRSGLGLSHGCVGSHAIVQAKVEDHYVRSQFLGIRSRVRAQPKLPTTTIPGCLLKRASNASATSCCLSTIKIRIGSTTRREFIGGWAPDSAVEDDRHALSPRQ